MLFDKVIWFVESCVCSYFSKKSLVWNLIFVVSYFLFLQERNDIHVSVQEDP